MYLVGCRMYIITERRDNEIEWDRRRVVRSFRRRSCRETAPFSFLLAIARYVQRRARDAAAAVSFAILDRVRAACSKQLTVTRASARGMKRGRSWNDGGGRDLAERDRVREKASVLYYLPRSNNGAASLLFRATRYFLCNCRFETA